MLTEEEADGYARADGIGALYIKNLSNAVADGDPIRAVIRGTAINAWVYILPFHGNLLTLSL